MQTFLTVLFVILGVILILLALLLFCPLSLLLSVGEKELLVKLRVLGISIRIPLGKKDKKANPKKEKNKKPEADKESVMKKFLEMRNTFARIRNGLGEALSYLCKKIHIPQMCVLGKFGLGDAALTGMSYGMVEAFTGLVTGFLQHYFVFDKPVYHGVEMDYDHVVFKLQFAVEVTTKPWYLVRGALIFYKHWKQS